MTTRVLSHPSEDASAMRVRQDRRARFWRLALGILGLFWICVLLLLMG